MLINQSDIGKRLDVFVAERGEMTRSASQKLIEDGYVTVNGGTKPKNYRISELDIVDIELPELEEIDALPEDIPLDVVYEDSSLIVVNKPKNMVVHPAPGNYSGTLVNALLYHCKGTLSGINGKIRPGIIHRIDKDTSGLLVVAKNDAAHIFLASELKSHKMDRFYEAVVFGNIKDDCGIVDAPIARHPTDRKKMAVVSGGREAVTHYKVIGRYNGFTHLSLELETGRTHQIRVHMSKIGHRIIGDEVYGNCNSRFEITNRELLSGQCLHAKTLAFTHPVTGEYMRFESELPDYFKEILRKLTAISGN